MLENKILHWPGIGASIAILAGAVLFLFLAGWLFKSVKKLHSPGTVFRIEDAVGKEAMVYQRIPKQGIGKISVTLYHFTYEIDAVSNHFETLASFTRVRVVGKADEKTVFVVPVK